LYTTPQGGGNEWTGTDTDTDTHITVKGVRRGGNDDEDDCLRKERILVILLHAFGLGKGAG
jgi:hypothetical protein